MRAGIVLHLHMLCGTRPGCAKLTLVDVGGVGLLAGLGPLLLLARGGGLLTGILLLRRSLGSSASRGLGGGLLLSISLGRHF